MKDSWVSNFVNSTGNRETDTPEARLRANKAVFKPLDKPKKKRKKDKKKARIPFDKL
eukprot:CAMPEP_0176357792 /NCGR_PEP_ID=MMETSP0126-20121128/15053_1 /TAXON_ID=141414 ORGANISM="Strombidinopsis acuminatum, Strain SPMC142" /NCGR_SAMPLE_ID=MMETSP0126 /ASSEMBLY_ACC=CAM_ASM_000229 /LENGTH=56 /DNA_ID=CAMNT_0017711605 /DNA_START=287 /DNA_END=457 /DNA_ORIENTATION=+